MPAYGALGDLWDEWIGDNLAFQFRFYKDNNGSPGAEITSMHLDTSAAGTPDVDVTSLDFTSDIDGDSTNEQGLRVSPNTDFDSEPYSDATDNFGTTVNVGWIELLDEQGRSLGWAQDDPTVIVADGQVVTVDSSQTYFYFGDVDDLTTEPLDGFAQALLQELESGASAGTGNGAFTGLKITAYLSDGKSETLGVSLPIDSFLVTRSGGTVTITDDFEIDFASTGGTPNITKIEYRLAGNSANDTTGQFLGEDTDPRDPQGNVEDVSLPGTVTVRDPTIKL